MPDISADLGALVQAGIVEQTDIRYRLTATGRDYACARGLGRGHTQAAAQAAPVSGQEGLVHGA